MARRTLGERLAEKLIPEGDCLVWTGGQNGRGYGQISDNYKKMLTHRVAWELDRGPIPEGKVIDHTCWNRLCCNVDHLRVATQSENNQSRSVARSDSLLGVRNVNLTPKGRYQVRVRAYGGISYGHNWDTVEQAAAEAAFLRKAFFGESAGKEHEWQ